MKAIKFAALGIAVAIFAVTIPVQAQSTKTPSSSGETSSVNGSSLIGIDNRTAQDDFSKFFGAINTGSTLSESSTPSNTTTPVRFNETLSLPDTSIFLQPARDSMNGNDGVQVQLDLGSLDREPQK
jgi:hypothetical protein